MSFFEYKTNTSLPYAATNRICILYSTMRHPGTQPTESRTAGAHGKWLSCSQIKSTIRRLFSRSSPLYTHPCVLAVLCKTHNIAYRLVASINSMGTPLSHWQRAWKRLKPALQLRIFPRHYNTNCTQRYYRMAETQVLFHHD